MATDLTVGLVDRPGSLANSSDVLGRAGQNIRLVYATLDGPVILAADDLAAVQLALG